MARISSRRLVACVAAALVASCCCAAEVLATRLPPGLSDAVLGELAGAKVRLDGSIEAKDGTLFLPVVPPNSGKGENVKLQEAFPDGKNPELLLFSNGWCYLKVFKKGVLNSVVAPNTLPEGLRKQLLNCKLPSDLLVPGQIIFPRSLKPIIGDLGIPTVDDSTASRPEFGLPPQEKKPSGPLHDAVFVTSPKNGNVVLLDGQTLAKLSEFPVEGTPSAMTFGNGKLFVTDQAKSRVLVFDLKKKQFEGNVVLAPHSAPKGLTMLPNSKFLYVSESAINDIAVVEIATAKVLMRTRVPAGPARMAITPNGFNLLVLNVPAGEVTFLSTLNQRVIGSVAVGSMPNAIVISKDSLHAFVSNRMSNTVSIVDISSKKVAGTIKTGENPTGLALSHDGTKLYVANAKSNTIGVYDVKTKQAINEVRLPLDVDFPGAIALSPNGKQLLISSESTDAVGVLNLEDYQFLSQPVIGQTSDDVLWLQTD